MSSQNRLSQAEMNARIDLAAAHRMAGAFGWTNVIYNHISLRLPGEPQRFLFKPHELMFEEVTASSLLTMNMDGTVADPPNGKTNPGFTIHAAILSSKPEINCVVHVHTDEGMAVSALRDGLLPISQDAMHFYNRIAYHEYDGLSAGNRARHKLVDDLGFHKAMIMRNHGLLTCAGDIATAILLMKYLTSSCKAQLMLQATGAEIVIPPPDACEAAARQWDNYYGKSTPEAEWNALLRLVDRMDSSYRN
jgi:ribulose-5-phosphate 4-epimerase/fuculose-1-phosphate aldolase